MVMNADDLIRSLNGKHHTRLLDAKTEAVKAKTVDVHPATNSGTMMDVEMVVEVAEKPVAPVHVGPIRPSIDTIKGAELSMWRRGPQTDIVLKDLVGQEYYGSLSGAMGAEGAFGVAATLEDKAFMDLIFEQYVEGARAMAASDNPNYTMCATALWNNRNREGSPLPRSFMVVEWKSIGNSFYPSNAILFDGDKLLGFAIERQKVTNPRQPQWKGRAQ